MRLTSFWHLAALVLATVGAQNHHNTPDDHVTVDNNRDHDIVIHDTEAKVDPPEFLYNKTHPPLGRRGRGKSTKPKKPTTAQQTKTSDANTPARKKPTTQPSTDSSVEYDLWPLIERFDMAHGLTMASKSKASREVSPTTLENANIPATLRVTKGSFTAEAPPRSVLVVRDPKRFDEAEIDLRSAAAKKRRTRENAQYGEMALQSIMAGSLFDPTNAIFSAITSSDKAVVWRIIGSGVKDPVPDLLLTVGQKRAAVIEVKTTTALGDAEVEEIMDNLDTYAMKNRKQGTRSKTGSTTEQSGKDDEGHEEAEVDEGDEDAEVDEGDEKEDTKRKGGRKKVKNGAPVRTLVDRTSIREWRGERRKTTKAMEQVSFWHRCDHVNVR